MYPLSYVINQSCQKASTVGLTPIKEDPSYIDWDRGEDSYLEILRLGIVNRKMFNADRFI